MSKVSARWVYRTRKTLISTCVRQCCSELYFHSDNYCHR